jgi:hypothetical protein
MIETWRRRSPERIPDTAWRETMSRVRGEFEEMPCLRVSLRQAGVLFGLSESVSGWVLCSLIREGFLELGRDGEYARRQPPP